MKRFLLPISLLMALLLTLSGCANAQGTLPEVSMSPTTTMTPRTSPMVTNNNLPGTNPTNDMTNTTDQLETPLATERPSAAGVATVGDARKAAEEIEDELERLSEVRDAEVVIAGKTAAVGLKFDAQYQGGIDERFKKIVQERIDGVVTGVTSVAITADDTLRDEIDSLNDRLDGAADMTDIQNQLNAIINKIRATQT